jgi:hypothetical protein
MNQYCGQCLSLAARRPTVWRHGIIARSPTLWRRGVRPPKRLSPFGFRYCDLRQPPAPWRGAMVSKHGALPYGVMVSKHGALPYGAVVLDLPKRLSLFPFRYCDPRQTPAPWCGAMVSKHGVVGNGVMVSLHGAVAYGAMVFCHHQIAKCFTTQAR